MLQRFWHNTTKCWAWPGNLNSKSTSTSHFHHFCLSKLRSRLIFPFFSSLPSLSEADLLLYSHFQEPDGPLRVLGDCTPWKINKNLLVSFHFLNTLVQNESGLEETIISIILLHIKITVWCDLPVVHQYSVFDKVQDVIKVGQVSDVDNLSPEEKKKKERKDFNILWRNARQSRGRGETGSYNEEFKENILALQRWEKPWSDAAWKSESLRGPMNVSDCVLGDGARVVTWWDLCDCWSLDWDSWRASGLTTELAGLDPRSYGGTGKSFLSTLKSNQPRTKDSLVGHENVLKGWLWSVKWLKSDSSESLVTHSQFSALWCDFSEDLLNTISRPDFILLCKVV